MRNSQRRLDEAVSSSGGGDEYMKALRQSKSRRTLMSRPQQVIYSSSQEIPNGQRGSFGRDAEAAAAASAGVQGSSNRSVGVQGSSNRSVGIQGSNRSVGGGGRERETAIMPPPSSSSARRVQFSDKSERPPPSFGEDAADAAAAERSFHNETDHTTQSAAEDEEASACHGADPTETAMAMAAAVDEEAVLRSGGVVCTDHGVMRLVTEKGNPSAMRPVGSEQTDNSTHHGEGGGGTNQRRVAVHAAPGTTAMYAWNELVVGSMHAEADAYDNDNDDDSDSEAEAVGHDKPLYMAPEQRQIWGHYQIMPHINWGDLFFDLFYVAAAYNMGALLISSMTSELWFHGIIYFVGIFGPLFNAWESKLVYEARYHADDYFHRIVEIVRVFFLSFSILHIKPIELMSDSRSAEMFFFTLGLLLECVIRIALKVELIKVGTGDVEAIRNHSVRKLTTSYVPLALFYLAGCIIAGVGYFHQDESSSSGGTQASSGSYGGNEMYGDDYNATDNGHDADDEHHRLRSLASSAGPEESTSTSSPAGGVAALGNYSTDWSLGDLPIALCALSYVLNALFTTVRKTVWRHKFGSSDFRKENVPSNIDFCIHRYGEWIMLMLGEAVLSLLIVETTENADYYFVACAGILTVIMVQVHHFESEPTHADHHAMWRGIQTGVWYSLMLQVLSMGLIAFGVSYKVMLKGIHKETKYDSEDGGDGHRRWLIEDNTFIGGEHGGGVFGLGRRYLAGAISVTDQAAAALFCASLTIVLIMLELIANLHRGMHAWLERLVHRRVQGKVLRVEIVGLIFVKVGLLVFLATLSQWLNDPKWIALCGFFVVLFLAGTRKVGWHLLHGTKKKKKKKRRNGGGSSTSGSVPSEVVNNKTGTATAVVKSENIAENREEQ